MATDCNSAKKYWQMVAVTGYSSESSALALETSLQCCPNVCLLAESTAPLAAEIAAIATLVLARRAAGKNFGVVVISDAFLTKHLLADEAAVGALVASELETQVRCSLLLFAFCSLSFLLFAHHFVFVRLHSSRRRSASC
jgi:6-phosphofructokinase